MKIQIFVVMLAGFLLSGCATLFSGTTQQVSLKSNPNGASASSQGENCTTPCELELPKGESRAIKLGLEGYQDKTVETGVIFNGIAVLNLLNLIGWAIDFGSGAAKNLHYDDITVDFEKDEIDKKSKDDAFPPARRPLDNSPALSENGTSAK